MTQSFHTPAGAWPDPAMLDDGAVMACFESLGGCGRGAEFGLAQHHYGALQAGLLRNADLEIGLLIRALERRFEGVGTDDQMVVFVHEQDPEWWTRDSEYWMATRSTIKAADVPEAQARAELGRQLTLLARKMIADLDAGDRVFVYRDLYANPDAEKRAALLRAVRTYGNAPLLILQYAEPPAVAGGVEEIEPGLFLGHLAHFGFSRDGQRLGPVHQAFLDICRETLALIAGTTSTTHPALDDRCAVPRVRHADPQPAGRQTDPGDLTCSIGLSDQLLHAGRTEDAAFEAFRTVVRHPASAAAYVHLATLLLATADFAGAEEAARVAVHLTPEDAHCHYLLSSAFMQQRRWPEAVAAAQAAAEREPANMRRFVHLAALQVAAGDLDGASVTQQRLAVVEPLCHGTLLISAIVRRQQRRLEEALVAAEEMTRRYPDSHESHIQLAEVRLALGEWPAAETALNASLERSPGDAALIDLQRRIAAAQEASLSAA